MNANPAARNLANQNDRPIDIIWNITLVCYWDCSVCCVDAVHVSKNQGNVILKSKGLNKIESFTALNGGSGSIYDQALKYRQSQKAELDFEAKLKVLENLKGSRVKLDFSGGDPLSTRENIEVLRIASSHLGRQQLTLTATGAGLRNCDPEEVGNLIGELNFTYDGVIHDGGENRPAGYALGNLKRAAYFHQLGVKTRAECPLSIHNIDEKTLRQLYFDLAENGIDKLLLIRLFPVGRGAARSADIPTADQYRQAVSILRDLEQRYGGPKVKLQCALKWLEQPSMENNPCDLFAESFGLTSRGILLTSPWAVGPTGDPLDDAWVLGSLVDNNLKDLLSSEKAQLYQGRLDENKGHCKIFSYINSKRQDKYDRIFDKADPLYAK